MGDCGRWHRTDKEEAKMFYATVHRSDVGANISAKSRRRVICWCQRLKTLVTEHHNNLKSGVVRSGAIINGPSTSGQDLVCVWSTETFRPWDNYAGSFE